MVNKYTSPGLFMCGMWLLLQYAVALYWDIPPLDSPLEQHNALHQVGKDEEEPLMDLAEVDGTLPGEDTCNSAHAEQSETWILHELGPSAPDTPPSSWPHSPDDPSENFNTNQVEFLREEVVVLLTAQFITLFNQTALETMVTPLTQKNFGFDELGNSAMYSLCGLEVIGAFFLVRRLSRALEDRVLLATGLLVCCGACVWCLVFLANPQGGFAIKLTEFIIGVFLQLLGLPFVAVSQVSLFSKVTAEKTQGFSQGVRSSVGGLATILGPLWAGGLTGNLYVMLGLMLFLLILIMELQQGVMNPLLNPIGKQRAALISSCPAGAWGNTGPSAASTAIMLAPGCEYSSRSVGIVTWAFMHSIWGVGNGNQSMLGG
ncbi:hypothetical protein P4O66_002998 [Electrophorus voltai]|uniref:Uncharacterized protein n=1 Tax=Electrophorus voltai TaxID=2609070 RepID=A0AAD8YVP4_9TELE|nr:hypothetical protein P4O66_002998 [Electrophorus voltai]